MSVEEARSVTASFSGTPLVPPPRTIGDVSALLTQPTQADRARLTADRELADREPDLEDELERRFPEYAGLVHPQPATVAVARASLRPAESLISLYVSDDRTYVWAVPDRGPVAFSVVTMSRSEVRQVVDRLRRSLAPEARTLGEIPPFDVALAHELYRRLLEPVEMAWKPLTQYRVVAFATHGLVPGDLDGLIQPALALTAPEVAGVDGDGLLTMEEVLALRLDADWVVLSACNTASGDGSGAEAISGLGRAFFYAGARALLVSHWPVETTSALALTSELFRRQRAAGHLARAGAMQQTMVWLMDEQGFTEPTTGRVVFSYAHPLFWAPFTVVGDGQAMASGETPR